MKKKIFRLSIYMLGLFILSIGISLSINSQLGVSPVPSIPYVLSQITGRSIRTMTLIYYIFCVLMQLIILGRDYKLKNLLQIGFSSIFGVFIDLAMRIFTNIQPDTYLEKLLFYL